MAENNLIEEKIWLSGIRDPGPNLYVQNAVDGVQRCGYQFTTDGNVNNLIHNGTSWEYKLYSPENEWCNKAPEKTYYIKAVLMHKFDGTPDPDAGHALDVWHPLTSDVSFESIETRTNGTYGHAGWHIMVLITDNPDYENQELPKGWLPLSDKPNVVNGWYITKYQGNL